MQFKVASWNINSVRLRRELIKNYVIEHSPDVLCLQETKCEDAHFPYDFFAQIGFAHHLHVGQKSYNGVAILSKHEVQAIANVVEHNAARQLSAKINGVNIHNFYVPAGGDEPDANINEKFADKLDFLEKMRMSAMQTQTRSIWVGDFNVAPHEHDVWSHKQLQNVVSHTKIEVEKLLEIQSLGEFIDVARHFVPSSQKSYSWWSYRNKDWQKSNRGRRLDHIWVSHDLREQLHHYHVASEMRAVSQPSDHVPIMATINI
jgi:exodeoxyribonuclease-3